MITRDELHNKIWNIANKFRGVVDSWDLKQYVLGILFYRFISENFTQYMNAGDDSINYANYKDADISLEIKQVVTKEKGYFIKPSHLFVNIIKNINNNEDLNTQLAEIFNEIEASAIGYESEHAIKGLFADFDTTSNRLGNTVKDKNSRLKEVLNGVSEINFGSDFNTHKIDLFGDAYEFLISKYAANAGKSGGEFFTPQSVSKLITKLAIHKQTKINNIYDPTVGSGSLLLQAKKYFDLKGFNIEYFGQEINPISYNLARMNMFLHNINYAKFNIARGDTLINPSFLDVLPFDVIVSNPPYSINWIGSDDPTLINDERFARCGVLAPKSKADFAFVLHCIHYLSSKGRAVIVCFPGIFYRGGTEQKIRQYLVDNNYIEAIITLAPNLFYGTSIAVNILVMSKNKQNTKIKFIDASELFKKETNNNILTDANIDEIIGIFDNEDDVPHKSTKIDISEIKKNDYNLSVSNYIESKDDRQTIDINKLNHEWRETTKKINKLQDELDKFIKEMFE
jgi:type I restriction enzyme M protein